MHKKIEYFKTLDKGKVVGLTLEVRYTSVFSSHCTIKLTNRHTEKTMEMRVNRSYLAAIHEVLTLALYEIKHNTYTGDFQDRIDMVEKKLKRP